MPFTFTPRIEENIRVCLQVSAGSEYAIGGPDSHVHAEFTHDALGGGLDGQPDRPVLVHDDLGPPLSLLQLGHNRHWDVRPLVLLRVATCEKEQKDL